MERLVANKIEYNRAWDMFYIKTDTSSYEGYLEYVDNKFLLKYFSEYYIVDIVDGYVVKELLIGIIERYYFSTQKLIIDYTKLNKELPFIDIQIIRVNGDKYLIKVKSIKDIFNCDINGYYIANMYYDLRTIKLLYNIGEGKILDKLREESLNKYKALCDDLMNF